MAERESKIVLEDMERQQAALHPAGVLIEDEEPSSLEYSEPVDDDALLDDEESDADLDEAEGEADVEADRVKDAEGLSEADALTDGDADELGDAL